MIAFSPSGFLRFGSKSALHEVVPILMLDDEEALVLGLHPAHQRLHANRLGALVRTIDPVLGTAAHVVPPRRAALVGELAGAELLEVVRRRHAGGVEEVLVLADALGARLRRLA